MTVSALTVTMIVAYILPAAVALLTKSAASAWVKQFVGALLAAATGVIVTATQLDGQAVISKSAVLLALGPFLSTQAACKGLWEPHSINARLAPGVGLGG